MDRHIAKERETARKPEHGDRFGNLALQEELKSARTLLETRTNELKSAQAFLGKTETLSYDDISQLVNMLNVETFHTSHQIAQELSGRYDRTSGAEKDVSSLACTEVSDVLGRNVVELLQRVSHDKNPTCLQIVLQASITECCSEFISKWSPAHSEINEILERAHNQLFQEERQSVSGRWRQLTRQQLRRLEGEDKMVTSLHDRLLGRLTVVLVVAGLGGSEGEIRHLLGEFEDKLVNIARQSFEAHKAIGEDIISSEFCLIKPRFGEDFLVKSMEDYDAGSGDAEAMSAEGVTRRILCTLGIGLQRFENEGGKEVRRTMLKSKVALESMMDDLLLE